jgi:hypothetical protein
MGTDDLPADTAGNGRSGVLGGGARERVLAAVKFTDHCVQRYQRRVADAPAGSLGQARKHLKALVAQCGQVTDRAPGWLPRRDVEASAPRGRCVRCRDLLTLVSLTEMRLFAASRRCRRSAGSVRSASDNGDERSKITDRLRSLTNTLVFGV